MTKIKFCPRCKSINVDIKIAPSAAFGVPQKWGCNDCGFEAYSIFPEKEVEEKKSKRKVREREKGWIK